MKSKGRAVWTANLLTLAACLPLMAASAAQAGDVEQLVEIAVAPGDSPVMLARYVDGGTGLLYSDDRGETWRLQCASAMAPPRTPLLGPMAILTDGTIVVRSSSGILVGDPQACTFVSESDKTGEDVSDFAVDPRDRSVLFALRGSRTDPSKNGLLRRAADGTWSELSLQADRRPVNLAVVARDGGVRTYVLALKVTTASMGAAGGGAAGTAAVLPEYVIRVSDDEGVTWQEHPHTVERGILRLHGVDPTNPDRLVLVIDRTSGSDDVIVSLDGGATTSMYMQVIEFGAVEWASDGRVWIGDVGSKSSSTMKGGLYAARSLTEPATKLPMAEYSVRCLDYRESDSSLTVCQRFSLGSVDQATGAFTSAVRFTEVGGFVACGADVNIAAVCEQQLCADYCGPAHYAIAPVCAAYDKPGCGVPVALEEGKTPGAQASGTTSATGGAAAADSGSGSGGASGAGASGAGASSAVPASSSPGNAGSSGLATSKNACSCSTLGRTTDASQSSSLATLATLALIALVQHRVRRRLLPARERPGLRTFGLRDRGLGSAAVPACPPSGKLMATSLSSRLMTYSRSASRASCTHRTSTTPGRSIASAESQISTGT